jgi:hypothetical protein
MVLPIVLLGESPIGQGHLVDGQFTVLRQTSAAGQPLADQSIELGSAGLRVPPAQVEIVAVKRDHGLPQRLVTALKRHSGGRQNRSAWQPPFDPDPVVYRIFRRKQAALPTGGRYPNSRIRREL